ncbi:hypothetical protein F7734_02890 [Scytonema sp. UIC 10036]|uniref:hypothetical protein n=1 Tax=Scytonema sp. UIC 10036 TaxID=2304196 RepID=UPI0012DACD01|nr:hypothetical protein [Scytonema sp. UIC 10036]MUG91490.1 hypothetical protein [Scytonema sp. UIC 10036]
MTRSSYDRFVKSYFKELLHPLGSIQIARRLSEYVEIDVWFVPHESPPVADVTKLGLLGRFAAKAAIFETFRDEPDEMDVSNSLLKLLKMIDKFERQPSENQQQVEETNLPRLWVLTPTASSELIEGFRARPKKRQWSPGVYFLAKSFRSAIVAIDELPETEKTLWLRILGKGKVRQQAIDELMALPEDEPLRSKVLELLTVTSDQ